MLAATLAGCGGGGDPFAQTSVTQPPPAPPGPGAANAVNVGSNAITDPTQIQANAAVWADLLPKVTITRVAISGPPVVDFIVTD